MVFVVLNNLFILSNNVRMLTTCYGYNFVSSFFLYLSLSLRTDRMTGTLCRRSNGFDSKLAKVGKVTCCLVHGIMSARLMSRLIWLDTNEYRFSSLLLMKNFLPFSSVMVKCISPSNLGSHLDVMRSRSNLLDESTKNSFAVWKLEQTTPLSL